MNSFAIRSFLFFALFAILNRCNFVNPNFFKPSAKIIFYLTKKKLGQDSFLKVQKIPEDGFYLRAPNPKITNFDAEFVDGNAENAPFSAYFEGWYYDKIGSGAEIWDFTKPIDFELKLYGKWSETKYQPKNKTKLRSLLFKKRVLPKLIDVSQVKDMSRLFRRKSSFNEEIGGWDVSGASNMVAMFEGATSFNQDIAGWNIAFVWDMSRMFKGASTFSQDLSVWRNACEVKTDDMFDRSGVKNPPNFDLLHLGKRGGQPWFMMFLKTVGVLVRNL